jgi:hypothetical protein
MKQDETEKEQEWFEESGLIPLTPSYFYIFTTFV